MSRSISHNSLNILKIIAKELQEVEYALLNPKSFRSTVWNPARMTPEHIYYSYNSLKKGGYIKEKPKGTERGVFITDKGKLELIKDSIKNKKIKHWDKKWRMLIFDIPEDTRQDRDFLRRQLHYLGFVELQKSVWIIPYEVKEEFKNFLKLCNRRLEGDVKYVLVEKLENDKELREKFGL